MNMKIQKSKASVKACGELVAETVAYDNRCSAIDFIKSAVSALSAYALEHPEDTVVTDSIANLGVVLLDLNSGV